MENKKAALELSIGTIVIIVIGMSMLILGLVLVRTIFTGSTDSIRDINDRVKDQIAGLFADGGANIVVKLGEGRTAKIRPGDDIMGIAFGARTKDGSAIDRRERLQYELVFDTNTDSNCVRILGARQTEELFITNVGPGRWNSFDEFEGSNAFAIVEVKVPEGTATCSQKVGINVRDTDRNEAVGGSFFIIEIQKSGLF